MSRYPRSAQVVSLVLVLTLTATAMLRSPGPALGDGVATVTAIDGLALRSAASPQAGILAIVPYGSVLSLSGGPTADGWYPVAFGSVPGWADAASLTPGLVSPSAVPQPLLVPPPQPGASFSPAAFASPPPPLLMVFSPEGLNLRAAPDSNAALIETMAENAVVQVTGAVSGGWYPVRFDNHTGWADGVYLKAADTGALQLDANLPEGASLATTPYGSVILGLPAPFEAGSAVATAPPDAQGRFIWPVASRTVTTAFKPLHQAIDIGQAPAGGNPVSAIADGIVTYAGGDPCCRYGRYVIVQHAHGYASLYAHLSRVDVHVGELVKQGQQLGLSGDTGLSTGPHLHFAIYYQGLPLDPLTVLPPGAQIQPGA